VDTNGEIAGYAVQCLEEGHLDSFTRLVIDLEQQVGARSVRRHLERAGIVDVCLKKAAEAAAAGDQKTTDLYLSRARRYADEDEIAAIAEENRFSFAVLSAPVVSIPRPKLGFVS
jgi:hypothetical protein